MRMRSYSVVNLALMAATAELSTAAFSRSLVARSRTIGGVVVSLHGARASADEETPKANAGSAAAADAATPAAVVDYPDFLPNPHPSLSAVDVVTACMDTLLAHSTALSSAAAAGLEVCFHFSSDRCRAAMGGSLDAFNVYAQNPTFAHLVHCASWRIVAVGPVIPAATHRGAMQTVLVDVVAVNRRDEEAASTIRNRDRPLAAAPGGDGSPSPAVSAAVDSRRFLWTLQQERRPPLQGCWIIHEVLYTKNAWQQTL